MSEEPEARQEILLETINPSDLTPDDLWDLAESLASKVPDFQFVPAYEDQHGAGVSWHEVLRIWVENEDVIKGGIFGVILEHVYDAMRDRFKRPDGKKRPKSIIVSSKESRQEILNVTIDAPDSQPVEVEVNIRMRVIPPKRPRIDG